ncbi:MAG: hypothetical protein JXA95_11090 [Spirochaetales bacterium]|nr:hypothetical protein [Spirochaetales bacterium]
MKFLHPFTFLLFFLPVLLFLSCDALQGTDEDPAPPWTPQYADNVTIVDSDINSAATWQEGKVYYVDDIIRITASGTLIIQPGTIVKFTHGGSLWAEAGSRIYANGTSSKPILFTSASDASAGGDSILNDGNHAPLAGDWHNVALEEGGTGSEFSWCRFSWGGREKYAVLSLGTDSEASVENCIFCDNLGGNPYDSNQGTATLDASVAAAGTVIRGNLFYRNSWPLAISCAMDLDDTNSFSFDESGDPATEEETNSHQGIFVNYGNISGTVEWDETEVPLCFFGNLLRVTSTGTLTIAGGAIIKSSSSSFLFEYGSVVNRTGAIFTSYRDDSLLGDTNADDTSSAAADGDWEGICVQDSDNNPFWLLRDNNGTVRYSLYTLGD